MDARSAAPPFVAALLLLAGCVAAPPTDDPASGRDVRVTVSNEGARAYVITLGVAPAGHRGFAAEFPNGTVREYPQAAGLEDLPTEAVTRAVSVRPIGDDVQTRTYRFDGPQSVTAVFEDVPRNASIYDSVAFPSGPEPMRSVGRVMCGPAADFVEASLRITSEGVILVSNHCAAS